MANQRHALRCAYCLEALKHHYHVKNVVVMARFVDSAEFYDAPYSAALANLDPQMLFGCCVAALHPAICISHYTGPADVSVL